jgi:hypothetical protein
MVPHLGSTAEAEYFETPPGVLRRNDKIRLMGWPASIAVYFSTRFVKGCLFDGWPSWYQRTIAETLLAGDYRSPIGAEPGG